MTEIKVQDPHTVLRSTKSVPVGEARHLETMGEQTTTLPRREFLKMAWGAMATLAAGSVSFIGLRFLASRAGGGNFGGMITTGLPEEFPVGSVTAFSEGRFYLVRLLDGAFLALYWKCTHLDCVVLWDEAAGRFDCPCHGSQFATDGQVLTPPAPKPLTRFPIIIEDGKLKVDTATPIPRDAVGPQDLLYLSQDLPPDQRWGQQQDEEWYTDEE
jgi:nitrite reductase/ring-hydroxylating ferredoxin subunit